MSSNRAVVNILAGIGLIAIGAFMVPALYGLIAGFPDIVRYIRMRQM